VQTAQTTRRLGDGTLRFTGSREIGRDVNGLAYARCLATRAGGNACALRREQPRGLAPDPTRRAGYQAEPIAEAEIHAGASVPRVTTILLARHGETDWNFERRVQGHTDRPLNELGRVQALELSRALEDVTIDAVYSSDLSRAFDTARIVAEQRSLPVVQMAGLRERHFGTWEGLADEEILRRFPQAHDGPWGDGETTDEMTARVLEAIRTIAAGHDGSVVLVVSHGGPLRAVLRSCSADGDGPIPNCHVLRLAVEDGEMRPID
jgi:broad specificity phosphatase PhoE